MNCGLCEIPIDESNCTHSSYPSLCDKCYEFVFNKERSK